MKKKSRQNEVREVKLKNLLNVFIISVPTPLSRENKADLSYV